MSGALYGIAFWVLLCVLGTLVWPAVLILPKLSWRWKLTRATARLLCACLAIPFETSGVPLAGESCVYVANHASFLDSFAIGLMSPEPIVFVAGGVLSHQRVVGPFLRRIGAVFVGSEGGKGRSSIESVLSTLEDVVRSGLKGAKITIEPVGWHFASTAGVIRRGPLPFLPRLVPAPRPRCLVPSVRVGQGRRDRHAPSADANPRTSTPRTCPVPARRSRRSVPLSYSTRNGRLVSASVQMP